MSKQGNATAYVGTKHECRVQVQLEVRDGDQMYYSTRTPGHIGPLLIPVEEVELDKGVTIN